MNNPFDRVIINPRERPLSSDINLLQSEVDVTLREVLKQAMLRRADIDNLQPDNNRPGTPTTGFFGDGFMVRQNSPAGLSVRVAPGIGFAYAPADVPSAVGGISGVDDTSNYKPLVLLSEAVISGIPAGPTAPNYRYDIIEVRTNRAAGNPLSRDVLDPGTGAFVASTVNKNLGYTLDGSVGVVNAPADSTAAISYKVGVAGLAPSPPTATPGYMIIGSVIVTGGLASITRANLFDVRQVLGLTGAVPFYAHLHIMNDTYINSYVVSPPGMDVYVVRTSGAANTGIFTIYVICGDGAAGCHINGTLQNDVDGDDTRMLHLKPGSTNGIIPNGLQAADVAAIASSMCSYPVTLPVGQPAYKFKYRVLQQVGGALSLSNAVTIADFSGAVFNYWT